MFLPVKRGKGFSLVRKAYGQCSVDLRSVKSVERLGRFEHHEIRDVDNIVDGTEADRFKALAKPFGAGSDLHAVDAADTVE